METGSKDVGVSGESFPGLLVFTYPPVFLFRIGGFGVESAEFGTRRCGLAGILGLIRLTWVGISELTSRMALRTGRCPLWLRGL